MLPFLFYIGVSMARIKGRKSDTYLDLTDPKIYNKLTPNQKYYIEEQNRIYKEKVLLSKEEYFDKLQSDFERHNAIKRQQYILSGEAIKESYRTFFENYSTGLRFRGESGLADLVEYMSKTHSSFRYLRSMYEDLPDLTLFYADKRSRTGRHSVDQQTIGDREETYAEIGDTIIKYARDAKLPKYVIDFILAGGLEDIRFTGVDIGNLTPKQLRFMAKNAS